MTKLWIYKKSYMRIAGGRNYYMKVDQAFFSQLQKLRL